MLTDQTFLEEYRTGTNNFVKEFYKKAFNESLRDIGYSFESAVADIIDNCITVKAKNLNLCEKVE